MRYKAHIFCVVHGVTAVAMLCLLLLSCSEKEEAPASPPAERTVLVYMAADNNLYKNARADIAEMLEAEVPASGKLVVYLDAPAWSEDTCPQLLVQSCGVSIYLPFGNAAPDAKYRQLDWYISIVSGGEAAISNGLENT